MTDRTIASRISVLVPAIVLALLASAAAADQSLRPGEQDPLQNPARLTLFADDEVFLPTSANIANYMWEIGLEAFGGNLFDWRHSERRNETSRCNYPARRIAAGRLADPLREQILCATNYRLDLLGPDPRTLELPDAGLSQGRPVSIAVGDLDRLADDEGVLYPEVAVAYAEIGDRVRILVFDREFEVLTSLLFPSPAFGDTAIAAGDFDGDGRAELVVAVGFSSAAAYDPGSFGAHKGELSLQTYDYDFSDVAAPRLVPGMAEPQVRKADGAFFSTDLVAGDMDGDGLDEIALLSYNLAPGSDLKLEVMSARQLRLETRGTAIVGKPALTSYASVAAGTLRYDPRSGYDVDRKQVATAFADAGGKVRVTAFDVSVELKPTPTKPLELAGTSVIQNVGPALTIGNYVGLSNVDSPSAQIAVNVPTAQEGGFSYPHFFSILAEGNLVLRQTSSIALTDFVSIGGLWSQELVAFDGYGDSLYLGAPVHITVRNLVDPEYVIMEPPKHIDYLPVDPNDPDGPREVINVSENDSFYVQLTTSDQKTLETSSTDTTSWNIGGSGAFTSKETVGGGFGDIVKAEVSRNLKIALSYDYNENTSHTNSEYRSKTTREAAQTNTDDQLVAKVRLIDIWRYPVYGLDLTEPAGDQGFYEVILPGPFITTVGAGLVQDWYNPTHQNGNILSYPQFGDPSFPVDLGRFVPDAAQEPVPEPEPIPLNAAVERFWDGQARVVQLDWTERAGSTKEKSYSSTLKENVDLSIGFTAQANLLVTAKLETIFDFNFHNSNSWSHSTISKEVLESSTGIEMRIPFSPGAPEKSYGFETLVYITDGGYFKVNHSSDPLGSQLGQKWWRDYYGQRPDPAVNLPNRFSQDSVTGKWDLTPGGAGHNLRGLSLRKREVNPATGTHDYFGRALDADSQVEVAVYVYNFSLGKETGLFNVRFDYAEIDPLTNRVIGPRVEFGKVTLNLKPLENRQVAAAWDVSELGGSQTGLARYYRLYVVADADNDVVEIHDGLEPGEGGKAVTNNLGFWPWLGGVPVFHPFDDLAEPAALDVALADDALALVSADGTVSTRQATPRAGERYHLRATVHASRADRALRHVLFRAAGSDEVVAHVTLRGLAAGDNVSWASWTAPSELPDSLTVEILEWADDAVPGNAVDDLPLLH